MSKPMQETVFLLARKKAFNPTPMYVPLSAVKVATVWRETETGTYFALGEYLGAVVDGESVVGLRYRMLTDDEKKSVTEAVKKQDRSAVVCFELSD